MSDMKTGKNIAVLAGAGLVIALAVWGPELLTDYNDRNILNKPHSETVETQGEGYRFTLNSSERIYILSQCLNSQTLPESELNAKTRSGADVDYQELEGTYAFVVNRKGPSGREITDQEIYASCTEALEEFKRLGILPDTVRETDQAAYDAVLYSAIDVLEPRNNVSVWKLSLANSQKNANKENRLIDAYIDADNGKIYEFYARTPLVWDELDPDGIMEQWSDYIGIGAYEPYESDNPLTETTPYYKKYMIKGMGEDKTVVTIGFYEGINEIFLKISK